MEKRPSSGDRNEPEKEPEELADLTETVSLSVPEPDELRDPFTPKRRPVSEDGAADESEAQDTEAEDPPNGDGDGEGDEDDTDRRGDAGEEDVEDVAQEPGHPEPKPVARDHAAHAAHEAPHAAHEAPHTAAHAQQPPPPPSVGRRRLIAAFWPPRFSRNQLVVGVLLAAFGAALAIQVHATNTSDQLLRAARPDDLVHILDDVTARSQRLDAELRDLQAQKSAIQNSADKAQAALQQAQQKAKDLQILAGTVKAQGPGITVTITDPGNQVKSATLLNTLEELRAAGAEVVQVDDVRVVVSSAFLDTADGRISLDGRTLATPYVFKVIGDPSTLQPALNIPGGVVANVKSLGASADIKQGQVLVDAIAPQPNPQFAKSG